MQNNLEEFKFEFCWSRDFVSEDKYGSRLWDRRSAVAPEDHQSSKPLNK